MRVALGSLVHHLNPASIPLALSYACSLNTAASSHTETALRRVVFTLVQCLSPLRLHCSNCLHFHHPNLPHLSALPYATSSLPPSSASFVDRARTIRPPVINNFWKRKNRRTCTTITPIIRCLVYIDPVASPRTGRRRSSTAALAQTSYRRGIPTAW
jgi:hypothetical protein